MKVIGITGGIGSGKSLVADILKKKYNAYIVNTDAIAKKQMEPGGASYQGVIDYFGQDIVAEDKSIDRQKLSAIVFDNKEKLKKLNELTHPQVLKAVLEEVNTLREVGNIPYIVIETALMIEAGYDYFCDEVWYVYSPEEERRKRLKRDRDYSDEKMDAIFKSQSKDAAFRERYSIIIENTGDVDELEVQIQRLLLD
ncbi:dephospho-CoA kinase [Lachnospiraceae bacterium MD1]|jgi:dephospho-CoA kinase|uniref:Dephospho-CoA kinase n=1 Tax=Variimorphobacter saccharofermentans TaxID=2755051 RepID=A0A839JYJ3_9FIRM|nr:dephospho-CoA kinase [Variimorphobacter saccharofermentans]MBB2182490.1 dephospho-CoA kinase [Variimorphobacter saccharofermentans]